MPLTKKLFAYGGDRIWQAQMHIRHFLRLKSNDPLMIACACRGCNAFRSKGGK